MNLNDSDIHNSAFHDSDLIIISVISNKTILNHAHNDVELIYNIRGNLQVQVNNNEFKMENSDFLLINSKEFHSFHSHDDNIFVLITFNYNKLCSMFNQKQMFYLCNSIKRNYYKDEDLKGAIEELISLYIKRKLNSNIQFMLKAMDLISILTRYYLRESYELELEDNHTINSSHDERINEIIKYIQTNYKEALSLEKVSNMYYISVPYLSKLFKKYVGTTFSRYLNKIRQAYAVNELMNTNKPITQIALDNGFPTLTSFNRVFYELNNMKPAEFRKQYLANMNKGNISYDSRITDHEESSEVIFKLREYLDSRETDHQPTLISTVENIKTEIIDTQGGQAYTKYWSKMINIGYARDLLNSDMQEQLNQLKNDLEFSYARVWGIFEDDMLLEDRSEGDIQFNFSTINKLLDILLNLGLKPFIELGPKPKIISKNIEETLVIEPIMKRSLEEWRNLSRAFLSQCVERFGIEEVETWYFEIWRPNFDFIRNRNKTYIDQLQDPLEFQEYFKLFGEFKKIAKEIVPSAKVGGCGLSMDSEGDKLNLLLQEWKKEEFQPDFLSVYLYPVEIERVDMQIPNSHSADSEYILNTLTELRRSLKNSGFNELELNVTEWNNTVSNRDYLNDSCFKATYMIKNLIENLTENKVKMIGYWLASDIFSDFRDSKNLLFGGVGLITKNGIKKPSYHAFALLKRLGNILVAKGENYIVTKKTGGSFQVLCFNYKHFDYSYYLSPEGSIGINQQYEIFENNDALVISIKMQGIRNGRYRVKKLKLNREHGSVLDEWFNIGQASDLKQDEIEYLKQICIPELKIEKIMVNDESIVLREELQPHEISLYEYNLLFNER